MISPAAFSQTITTADAVGVVSDTSGAVVPGATVTLKSAESGESRTETTNGQGQYRFPLLKPGDYVVSASLQRAEVEHCENHAARRSGAGSKHHHECAGNDHDCGGHRGSAPSCRPRTPTWRRNYNKSQVDNLPMPGGDLTTLAMTVPGIRVNVTGGSSNMNANGIPGLLHPLHAQWHGPERPRQQHQQLRAPATTCWAPTQSVKWLWCLNAYSPQYGRMAGAQVNMVGLSGTNQFHGNLFYNFNWEDLNANSFFNNSTGTPRGRSDAHQFGGRIGGPIWKNKLFFFFDDENLRYVLPAAGVVSLPSPQLQAYTLAHVAAAERSSVSGLFQPDQRLSRNQPRGSGDQRHRPVAGRQRTTWAAAQQLLQARPTGTGGIFGVNTPCAVAFGINDTEINTEQKVHHPRRLQHHQQPKTFFAVQSRYGHSGHRHQPHQSAVQLRQPPAVMAGKRQPHLGDHARPW